MKIRVYLERVRLDTSGYVRKGQALRRGQYFGIGRPLYRAYADWTDNKVPLTTCTVDEVFRAYDRQQAKEIIRELTACFPPGAVLVFSGKGN